MIDPPLQVYWRIGQPGLDGVPALADAASWLSPEEISHAGRFKVLKRRADWIAGRLNLKALLVRVIAERYGVDIAHRHLMIERQPSGAPCVRLALEADRVDETDPGAVIPVSISNSHSHDRAFGAALWPGSETTGHRVVAVGADLEFLEPRSEAFVADFLTVEERAYWAAAAEPHLRDLRANLVWSAKESVLKVLQRGLTADTYWLTCLPDDATVPSGPCAGARRDGSGTDLRIRTPDDGAGTNGGGTDLQVRQSQEGEPVTRVVKTSPPATGLASISLAPGDLPWRRFSVGPDPRLGASSIDFAGFWREHDGFVATLAIGQRAVRDRRQD